MKKCNKCGETKELTEFHKDKIQKDGRMTSCKECRKQHYQANREKIAEQRKQYYQANREKIAKREKQYYQENRENLTEYQRQYYQKNREKIAEREKQRYQANREKLVEQQRQYYKENREKAAEYQKQYYQENREKVAEYQKQYRQANSEKYEEYQKQYLQENLEAFNARNQKRRALKRNAAGNATAADIQARFDYHGNRCYYCGCDGPMEVEHRIPLSRGGTHYPANLVPACKSCNCSKGTKTELEFKNRAIVEYSNPKTSEEF